MKKSTIIRELKLTKTIIDSCGDQYDDFTSPEGVNKRKKKLKKAIKAAIDAVEENKKLRKEIKNLKKKLAAYEYLEDMEFVQIE